MIRAFGMLVNVRPVSHEKETLPSSKTGKPWWQSGALLVYSDSLLVLAWNFFKTIVVAVSFFTFIF
jgi:hypothetical protein